MNVISEDARLMSLHECVGTDSGKSIDWEPFVKAHRDVLSNRENIICKVWALILSKDSDHMWSDIANLFERSFARSDVVEYSCSMARIHKDYTLSPRTIQALGYDVFFYPQRERETVYLGPSKQGMGFSYCVACVMCVHNLVL